MTKQNESKTQSEGYIQRWYRTEKRLERLAGVLLFFVVGIIIAFDHPVDQWTLTAICLSIAGGLTLLFRSRRPQQARNQLRFAHKQTQIRQAIIAGLGAIILWTQWQARPLAWIVGGVLLVVAVWYQWRARQLDQLDQLFTTPDLIADTPDQ